MPDDPSPAPEASEESGPPEQLALIAEPASPVAPKSRGKRRPAGPLEPAYLAEDDPVAQVRIESHVPHLDRVFDYGVSRTLAQDVRPGTRVRVRFGGQQLRAWVVARTDTTEVPWDRLQPVLSVLSALPVLSEPVLEVAEQVAERTAGTVADVLRCAVPPRVASVEKKALESAEPDAEPAAPDSETESETDAEPKSEPESDGDSGADGAVEPQPAPAQHWRRYEGGEQARAALARGERVRAVVQALPSHPDHDACDLVAEAVAAELEAGRGSVVVVPDHKTLERMQSAVEAVVPAGQVARLHSEDKPTPRYRAFVQALQGQRRVVVGTRPAVWAPVADLGLIVVFDDGDTNLVEPRAPYHHARDVALLRAQHQELSLLVVGHAVTPEAQRLVETGWAVPIAAQRSDLRAAMPRIVATSDSWHEAHDSLAGRARLPETAFRVARKALESGSVLVQVARAGYAPVLSCDRCRNPARCTVCDGPLAVSGHGRQPLCSWCGHHAVDWSCPVCSHTRWRFTSVGSERTAEELGRAFPQVPVIWSSGAQIRREIGTERALVVATPGAEPHAPGRYAAALLLDGDRMLSHPGLRVEEAVLRRWAAAAALVRPAGQGGTVVVTSEHERAVSTLVRWDMAGHAARELAERRTLSLPPAVRCAALTGPLPALEAFLELAALPESIRAVGPAPVQEDWAQEAEEVGAVLPSQVEDQAHRVLLFFSYAAAAQVTHRLRAARAEASALRRHAPVNVRCDVADLL